VVACNLTKRFNSRTVVRDISFAIDSGQCFGSIDRRTWRTFFSG